MAIEDLWGTAGAELPTELGVLNEAARVNRLESALLQRIGDRRGSGVALNVPGLAEWMLDRRGRLTVECLAN